MDSRPHTFGYRFRKPPCQENNSIYFNGLNRNGGPPGPPLRVVSAAGRQILPGILRRAPPFSPAARAQRNQLEDADAGSNFSATPFMQ